VKSDIPLPPEIPLDPQKPDGFYSIKKGILVLPLGCDKN
jgi:hypothetical protein